jgi:hypothetical protein
MDQLKLGWLSTGLKKTKKSKETTLTASCLYSRYSCNLAAPKHRLCALIKVVFSVAHL